MELSRLYRRYDGPIPPWELPLGRSDVVHPYLRFHRRRALDAAKAVLRHLSLALAAQAAVRLDHWHDAVRLLNRYSYERRAHSAGAISAVKG